MGAFAFDVAKKKKKHLYSAGKKAKERKKTGFPTPASFPLLETTRASSLSLSLIVYRRASTPPEYLPQLEKKSRTSLTNTSGLSSAAKCPPELARVKCLRLLPAAIHARGGLKSSRGMSSTAVGTRT